MDLDDHFVATSRKDLGLLLLQLVQGVDIEHLKEAAVVNAWGGKVKSYMADIWLYHLFDGYDPMEVIDGLERDRMCLEDYPKHAMNHAFLASGTNNGQSVGFMFSVHADTYLDFSCNYPEENGDVVVGMRAAFKDKMASEQGVLEDCGGVVFCSTSFWDDEGMDPSDGVLFDIGFGGSKWDRVKVDINVISSRLENCTKFKRSWENLVDRWGDPSYQHVRNRQEDLRI